MLLISLWNFLSVVDFVVVVVFVISVAIKSIFSCFKLVTFSDTAIVCRFLVLLKLLIDLLLFYCFMLLLLLFLLLLLLKLPLQLS